MKVFPFSNPPKKAGIYLLRNSVTQMQYVGKSTNLYRRYTEWKMVFTQKFGIRSHKLLDAVADSSPEDWELVILAEFDDITDEELSVCENEAIARISAERPGTLLNTNSSVTTDRRSERGSRSMILRNGEPIPFSEAARELGCGTKQLQKRMARYRQKGRLVMDLEELKALTARFRP